MSLTKKIDFALILKVTNANPNGDPLNGNRPRADFAGFGEITDVCLKRKIRDRLQDSGENIFVQSDEKKTDGMTSLANRAKDENVGLGVNAFNAKANKDETAKKACEKWLDVRSFGQVFAFAKNNETSGVSIAVRGPVTLHSAFSVKPVIITSTQITKSVSGEGDGSKKSSDTMGMKHRVNSGIYVAFGAMSPQLAERTGFSDDDAEKIKSVLTKLFEGDASSARPEGSMQVLKLIWWEHNCKSGQYSSAKVHGSLNVNADGSYTLNKLDGLEPKEIDGF
ncbi:CRISPR-associated Csd2 family protein [Cricetibacter osteomyelitidis]|uniref:CRISPR-associated Csd2 family protein n=1 Tax=Cricetibacter osteomyelitidis TaxID=1521931 RepID=A0A4R2SJW7_9PAST|nr:type I-C CRISPR-associated protein Cas7/Csd2 [Cricetibacter osteomyelitidis]TCP90139.1 CRISPR-associated Csd2 family protein [Cricetibacter osteomyelitidis]